MGYVWAISRFWLHAFPVKPGVQLLPVFRLSPLFISRASFGWANAYQLKWGGDGRGCIYPLMGIGEGFLFVVPLFGKVGRFGSMLSLFYHNPRGGWGYREFSLRIPFPFPCLHLFV